MQIRQKAFDFLQIYGTIIVIGLRSMSARSVALGRQMFFWIQCCPEPQCKDGRRNNRSIPTTAEKWSLYV